MCIKDPINKTCWKNGKDLSNGALNIKLWNHTKKKHFPVFARHEAENFFCHFPNPWTLRVSGMGCYTSKCDKKSKSLHPKEDGCISIQRRIYIVFLLILFLWLEGHSSFVRGPISQQQQDDLRSMGRIAAVFFIVLRDACNCIIQNIIENLPTKFVQKGYLII